MVAPWWSWLDRPGDVQRVQRVVQSIFGGGLVRTVYVPKPPVLQVEVTLARVNHPQTLKQCRRLRLRLGRLLGRRDLTFARIQVQVVQEAGPVQWQAEITPLRRSWLVPLGLGLLGTGLGSGWWWHHSQEMTPAGSTPTPVVVHPKPAPPVPWAWGVQRVMDRQWLAQQLRGLPPGTAVYAAQIEPGVGGRPAYRFYEAGLGAFSQKFWPASTVKILPAVAALEWVHAQEFSSQVMVTLPQMRDRLERMIDRSLRESSNWDYDLTVQLVGLDWLNQQFLSPERGFPTTQLQRSYSGVLNIHHSPGLMLQEGNRQKYVPPRTAQGREQCPAQGNCTNLFEMTEAIRRVVLHEELDEAERFRIPAAEAAWLRESLCRAEPSFFAAGARSALGVAPRICHKPGWVLNRHCVESGVVLAGRERYLLAVAMPTHRAGNDCQGLSQVAYQVLQALRTHPSPGMLHQPNQGAPVWAQLIPRKGVYEVVVRVRGANRVAVWLDREFLGEQTGPGPAYRWLTPIHTGGERLLRVQAWQGEQPVAYHSQKVTLTQPLAACSDPPSPIPGRVIYRGPSHRPQVAISFDDGPHAQQTPRILDILQQEGVSATFFVQGRMVRRSSHLIGRMQAETHEIANHSTTHPALITLSPAEVRQEMRTTQALVCQKAGVRPRYFRPPYGKFDRTTIDVAAELGLALVLWDVDTRDWQHRNPQQIIQTVQNQARAGSIILMHDIYSSTVAALPGVIAALRAKGLELVTVSELLHSQPPEGERPKESHGSRRWDGPK